MKIIPARTTAICRRCLLPGTLHKSIEECLLNYQYIDRLTREAYDKLKKEKELIDRAHKNIMVLLWKVTVGRGRLEFSRHEIEAIPKTASLTMVKKDGGLTIEAIVKPDPTEKLS